MPASFLTLIDWSVPWLAPYTGLGQSIANAADWRQALNDAATARQIRNFHAQPIHFIPQEALPARTPYELHIGRTGCVPTRDNLHDFFNALVWLSFPAIKARLNELQFRQLEANAASCTSQSGHKLPNTRGRLRDAATVFDENSALLVSREQTVVDALVRHEWQDVFVGRRDEFRATYDVVLFGHALMEKLVSPYASITAHCFPLVGPEVGVPVTTLAEIDQLAAKLLSPALTNSAFFPVPVFGLPGWAPGQDSAFYQDASVFRPLRQRARTDSA
ncbi:MAG: hypothetical protein JWP36_2802 [Paucimonas sp.]|nr:hypothetical protein [Paucimonas sp.]